MATLQLGEFSLHSPQAPLISAFNASGLFLVGADGAYFSNNQIGFEGWNFTFAVGADSFYNDYHNILLVKSTAGKLFNPDQPEQSLVSNPLFWTQRDAFSSPLQDAAQQTNLARFLTDYFAKAYAQRDNPYFKNIANIATDENWQGFLFLNVSLTREDFPPDLRFMVPNDAGGICMHHFGARLTPLKAGANGPVSEGETSLFGLIYYEEDGFCGSPLPPDSHDDFEYKLDELKVLFENTTVARFESTFQFTIGNFLGQKPVTGGCPYNTVLLKGAYQSEDGVPVYTMRSDGESKFLFKQEPFSVVTLEHVSVTSAQDETTSFAISGRMELEEKEADIWSYKTLCFSGMNVVAKADDFRVDLSGITFDLAHSTARDGSFAKAFALTPRSILTGAGDDTPQKRGYAPIITDFVKSAAFGGAWYGINLDVALGTTGELAGHSGINASLLLAWDEKGKAFAGIALPGAVMIENVLGLTTGAARLTRENGHFLLSLSDIALKCFGLLKLPSSGSLSMSLSEGIGWFAMYKK